MSSPATTGCYCWSCNRDRKDMTGCLPYTATVMILCPDCGNKRCPRATDHRLACGNSNETGQPGSRYQ